MSVERAVFVPAGVSRLSAPVRSPEEFDTPVPAPAVPSESTRTRHAATARTRTPYSAAVHKPSPVAAPAAAAAVIPAPASTAGTPDSTARTDATRAPMKPRPPAGGEPTSQQPRVEGKYPGNRTPASTVSQRSREQSIAIMAGSAAAGALIGAIAGHGKGAAIGALSGGAIGVIYDRMTRNKTVSSSAGPAANSGAAGAATHFDSIFAPDVSRD